MSSAFAPFAQLGLMRKSPNAYYASLIDSPNDILRAAGWCALLDSRGVPTSAHQALLRDCRFGGVKRRAVEYFEQIFEHDLAAAALEVETPSLDSAVFAAAEARLTLAHETAVHANIAAFLASGAANYLTAAIEAQEADGGWRKALELAVDGMAAQPLNGVFHYKLVTMLESARQTELLRELGKLLVDTRVLRHVGEVTLAVADQVGGDSKVCLERLERISCDRELAGALAAFDIIMKKLRAEALSSIGEYREAYEADLAVNATDAARSKFKANDYYVVTEARSRYAIPQLPPDERNDCIQMLGFPRSGTTLLENALASHRDIETFEEVNSLQAAYTYIERVQNRHVAAPSNSADIYVEARKRYYRELDRIRQKSNASVLIDKLPIRAAEATFLKNLFPEQRYIFSIRHPFDVALSCFRQRFAPNPAMDNFHTIGATARLYDYAMSNWFKVHGIDDPLVHYVRYEDLVLQFEAVARSTSSFLGLDWDGNMLNFASRSDARAAKTPSYAKVRQGLSIGVQTNWRNFDFLFTLPEAQPLKRWAEFFGYDTK